jgi:alpha-2-macroglobulin
MILRVSRLLAACSVLFCAVPAHAFVPEAKEAAAQQELRITRITPEGTISTSPQIVLQFNRPVVPIGDMARKAEDLGVTITPPLNCEWRWLNTSALSCNLGEKDAMTRATEYKVHVEPKIQAEDGAMIAESFDHSFTTQTPASEEAFISTWTSPLTPEIYISFNQPVTKASIEQHIYFEDEDSKTRVAAQASVREDDETPSASKNGVEARYNWRLKPASDLPENKAVLLREESGLVSADGDAPGAVESGARDLKKFYTFPALAVRGIVCRNAANEEVLVTPGVPQTDEQLCNPLAPINISFTASVLRSALKDNLVFTPDLTGGKKDVNPWGDFGDWSRLTDDRSAQEADYRITLPYGLKAAQEYTLSVPEKKISLWARIIAFFKGETPQAETILADEFGRKLAPFKISFATGHRNPNYELPYNDAVLEKNTDSEPPLYVNNLKSYTFDYTAMDVKDFNDGSTGPVAVAQVQDIQFGVPADVRGMLKSKSGALYGNLSTDPVVENKWEGARRLFAQVTPFQVYSKLGHFKSSIWVTDLATGKPVQGASVSILQGALQGFKFKDALDSGVTDENGVVELDGLSKLDPDLSLIRNYKDELDGLAVMVDKGDDMALLPIKYEYEVQLWNVAEGVYNDSNEQYGHMKSWGMTAQGIYRAGDTMQYKIFVRDQGNNGFVAPPAGDYELQITDPTGKEVDVVEDVKLSAFGTFDGEYNIPKNAPVGWYQFKLSAVLKRSGVQDATKEFYPLSVLVSDFTPAPFRVGTELNGDAFKAGDKLEITSDAKLHSGGPYGEAAIRSTVTLRARSFTTKAPAAAGFTFDSFKEETDSEDIFQKDDKLDDKGEWTTHLSLPEKNIAYGQLIVESAVRDERGKSIASEARADYAGVDRLVGLKPTEWVFTAKKPTVVQALVVDNLGAPVENVKVHAVIEKEDVVTAKVKGAGNAYLSDNTVEWREVAKCDLESGKEGKDCTFTPDSAGTYRVTANIKDTKDRPHSSEQILWVGGDDYVQWNEGRENALTILPEKSEYKVGDTARYLVKNPYPDAYALVTVERLGVIDHWVQKLEGSTPVLEIPVKPDYTPGFYLSVVAMSGRVDAPVPELGQIDLGKPTFRVGYAKTPVVDPYKTMTVTAKAEAEEYRPRDKVKVSLEAKPLHEGDTKEPIELAVAVLDESVFDLIADGKNAFDPYHGFYDLDNLDVLNHSLMTRLMGRQKFEKKGANPGGDGGIDASMRNLFKFVSYWNPSVPVDENGKANIEFDAPDNLTGWRILALAVTPSDRMGLGEANFKVNRPTELRPVMPNQVREGDKFKAGFSVMNRTAEKRTIKVAIKAKGDIKGEATHEESVTLEPYKRGTVYIPLEALPLPVTRDVPEGKIAFSATAKDDMDADGIEHTLPVLKSRTTEVAANYGSTVEEKSSESIAVPKDIFTDSSDLSVTLSPTIIGNLDGAFTYMRDYAYPCWEQKLTTALVASHYGKLKPYLDAKTVWDGAEKLPQDILDMAGSYQAPNGGMAYYVGKDEYVDPYLSAYTALAFIWLEDAGYEIPLEIEDKLITYLQGFLRNKTAPDYYQDGMTSSVRAVSLAALVKRAAATKDDVLRFQPELKNMNLFGKAHFAQAALAFPETKKAANEALGMLLSAGAESGGKFSLNESYNDGYERILSTPLRDNCAALDTILLFGDNEGVKDIPAKLVRYITQSRGNRDHWENTQENIFCLQSIIDYAKKYESVEPDMKVAASYAGNAIGTATFEDVKDAPVTLTKPLDDKDAGSKGTLTIDREGDGRLYYATRLRYAPRDLKDAVNAGIDIRREYSIKNGKKWELATSPVVIKRGDLVKVDLFISLPTARNFVVVNDPLPGGLETINRDLATASKNDADEGLFDESGGSYWFKFNDWNEYNFSRWSFYYKELRHDSARFYADWLDVGNYHLSYMAQAVADGTFAIPPVKAEEMYDPDVFGIGVKEELRVEETP